MAKQSPSSKIIPFIPPEKIDFQERIVDSREEEYRTKRIIENVLVKIRKTPDKTRRLEILKALAGLDKQWIASVFWKALSDPSEGIRDFLIKELTKREPLDLDAASQSLNQTPWFVKAAVLKILAIRKNADALALIQGMVEDANVEVRRQAALALGKIGGEEAKRSLVRLTKDKHPYVRSVAIEILQSLIDFKFT
jgi:hypothetical protein